MNAIEQDCRRYLRIAWSCLKDAGEKVEAIREAGDAVDREAKDGTFRNNHKVAILQGSLEREYEESLEIAWISGIRVSEIDAHASVEINGTHVTPRVIFGAVCGLRGDLQFVLGRWDTAIGFYAQSLQHNPGNPACYFNIGAAYTNKHEPAAAIKAFEKAMELDPAGEYGVQAAKNLEKLQEL